MDRLLDVTDLVTCYGLSRALHGVSLEVRRGELVALLGRNGVGKSTTLKSIMGLVRPRSGSILWKGEEIAGREPCRNVRSGLGYVPEERRIFADLSVWENLDVARRGRVGGAGWDEQRVFELFPDLGAMRARKGGVLSGGQQQMLTVARSLMGNPELLLLDEPSEGLAPLVVAAMRDKIAQLKAGGLSIVLAEQNLEFVLSLADRIYVLEKGEVKYVGTPEALRASGGVMENYLLL